MKELNELVEQANRANIAGQGTPEMADFRVTASPDKILDIAEAFQAMEKRAEAAEANLAEFAKQDLIYQIEDADGWQDYSKDDFENFKAAGNIPDCYFRKLFTRPAPAVSLADLVRVSERLKQRYICNEGSDVEFIACVTPVRSSIGTGGAWDDWRELSSILRNIEEQS